jgi:hypothetical protein
MNFAYLLVPGCNNCTYPDGLQLLNKSIISLKLYEPYKNIYIYYGFDESSKDKIFEIQKYIIDNNLIGINIGYLKHDFGIFENKEIAKSINNPYRLNILIEKLYILLNHDENEEICFVDLDTLFKDNSSNFKFDLNIPILYDAECRLLNTRNLRNFFKVMNYNIDDNYWMFNSGFIYIPLNMRKKIAKEAIDLVIDMNNYSDELRCARDIDEQIAISIIIYKYYGKNIKLFKDYLIHTFGRHILNNKNYN